MYILHIIHYTLKVHVFVVALVLSVLSVYFLVLRTGNFRIISFVLAIVDIIVAMIYSVVEYDIMLFCNS